MCVGVDIIQRPSRRALSRRLFLEVEIASDGTRHLQERYGRRARAFTDRSDEVLQFARLSRCAVGGEVSHGCRLLHADPIWHLQNKRVIGTAETFRS